MLKGVVKFEDDDDINIELKIDINKNNFIYIYYIINANYTDVNGVYNEAYDNKKKKRIKSIIDLIRDFKNTLKEKKNEI